MTIDKAEAARRTLKVGEQPAAKPGRAFAGGSIGHAALFRLGRRPSSSRARAM